jgi:dethiobiotin synthetase
MGTRIVFITGTDTGVGKTLLTALLLCHLRAEGSHTLALKPFCSGTRADAQLLHDLQDRELTLEEVNPYYFPEPVAPLVSARRHKRRIPLDQVVQHIHAIASHLAAAPLRSLRNSATKIETKNFLLIEGLGGLLVPLGKGYAVRDVIARLNCEIIVVSRNKLGTINHTLLTVQALLNPHPPSPNLRLRPSAFSPSRVILMDSAAPDVASRSNAALLCELLAPIPLYRLPFLGPRSCAREAVKKNASKVGKVLARIVS